MDGVDDFMQSADHVGVFVFDDDFAVFFVVEEAFDIALDFHFGGFFVGGFAAAAEKCPQCSE